MKSTPVAASVRRIDWLTESDQTAADFMTDARSRGGFSEEAWRRVLWHGGLFAGRRRFAPERDELVPRGTQVRVYAHLVEPRLVPITREHICLDERGVVAVNKPSGLAVQGTRASQRLSLETQLKELLGCDWLAPVHRLDAETSGVNLFARDPASCEMLAAQFRARTVEKRYLAWVSPVPPESSWCVSGYIVQVPHARHAAYALCREPCTGGRFSDTAMELLEVRGRCALVLARPHSGRTHQIRVHLAHGGTPILGDSLYGGEPSSRLLLHAESIILRLPGDAEPTTIRAPAGPELAPPSGARWNR